MKTFRFILGFAALAPGAPSRPCRKSPPPNPPSRPPSRRGRGLRGPRPPRARDTLAVANTQVEAKDYKAAKLSALDAKTKARRLRGSGNRPGPLQGRRGNQTGRRPTGP